MPEDIAIMSLVEEEMVKHATYCDEELTEEILANHLQMQCKALSRAINRTTHDNFNQYINRYRIQYAIQLMEGKNHHDIHIDEIYELAGFKCRASFYRAFKHQKVVSPFEYQITPFSGV